MLKIQKLHLMSYKVVQFQNDKKFATIDFSNKNLVLLAHKLVINWMHLPVTRQWYGERQY